MAEDDQELVIFEASDEYIRVSYILLCMCLNISKLKV